MNSGVLLVVSLVIILIGAEIFTNGIEWLGERLNLSEGAVGSILAAVGTALPETLIPIIAILLGGEAEGKEIGIGAILGAPLMLSTLAMFVTGVGVIIFRWRRVHGLKLQVNKDVIRRDLGFFLIVFTAAVLVGALSLRRWQLIIGAFMVFSYLWYVYVTITESKGGRDDGEELRRCYFCFGSEYPLLRTILFQVAVSLCLIILGADGFVTAVRDIAHAYGVPAFVLSLIIAPVATELPEKFNSIIWVSRGKDTLALGNITGAMVFQSSLIPALGIFLTDWRLSVGAMVSALCALLAAAVMYVEVTRKGYLSTGTLLFCGVFYLVFLMGVIQGIIR